MKKVLLNDVKDKVERKDTVSNDFSRRIAVLEMNINVHSDSVETVQRKIKDLENNYDSEGEQNVESLKAKLKQLDDDIEHLKHQRTEEEAEYQKTVNDMLRGIAKQKEEI